MNIRTLVLLLGLSLAVPVQADAPGRVWVYQPDGASYRIGGGAYRYDPRSPYPQHRQYRPNLPPRYQGQLPPQYYDRHRGLDRPQRWDGGRRHGLDRSQRWRHEHRQNSYRRGQGWNQRHDYRPSQRGSFDRRSYRRH